MKSSLHPTLILECRKKLLQLKQDLLNRAKASEKNLILEDRSGDEIDQAVALLQENTFLIGQERMRTQLLEIEMALAKIADGSYGICEETEEMIEIDRLRALPWTRLSIEGAEIREAMNRKFAR
ncbi:MAG: TraR/DksA family transcriptional regulator [Pseudobdellovibrionaceae bacterium]